MALETKPLTRKFRYNSVELPDPGAQYTPDEVRGFYAATYSEIVNAAIEGPEEKDGALVYTFRRAVGTKGSDTSTVLAEVAAERQRQIEKEGWTHAHDDDHDAGELACAGAAYALNAGCVLYPLNGTPLESPPEFWMWDSEWWKPKDPRRDLIRALALITAEVERMDRHEPKRTTLNPQAAWPFPSGDKS